MEARSESERFSRMLSIVQTGDMIEPGVFIVDDLEIWKMKISDKVKLMVQFDLYFNQFGFESICYQL